MYKYLMGNNEDKGVRPFSAVLTGRTIGKGQKLRHMRSHLSTRKKYCEGSQTQKEVALKGCGVGLNIS